MSTEHIPASEIKVGDKVGGLEITRLDQSGWGEGRIYGYTQRHGYEHAVPFSWHAEQYVFVERAEVEFEEDIPGLVDAYRHEDGSITYVVLDNDASDSNPRTFDGNAATLIQENPRCIDIDSDDAGLAEAHERWDCGRDASQLMLRYLSIFRPDIVHYEAHWSAGDSYGWGYITAEAWGETTGKPQENFDAEVEIYRQWAEGEVYGSIHVRPDGTDDACWGHLGYDDHEDIAKQHTDSPIREVLA